LPPDPGAPSVVLRKHHRRDRPFPLTTDFVGEDPELAVLDGAVAGEEAAIAVTGGLVVGGLVVLADLAPVARGMAIQQGGDPAGSSLQLHHDFLNKILAFGHNVPINTVSAGGGA
jgi:hypothetical protein